MLNSKTTTTVRIAQMEWLTMSRGSRRKTSSEMSASASATFPANTGFRGSARANVHSSATAPHAAPHQRATAPPARRSRPSLGCCCSPSWEVVGRVQAEESSGTAAPRWSSSVDHSDPSRAGVAGVGVGGRAAEATAAMEGSGRRKVTVYVLQGDGSAGGACRRYGSESHWDCLLWALGFGFCPVVSGREDVQLAEKSAVRCSVCLS